MQFAFMINMHVQLMVLMHNHLSDLATVILIAPTSQRLPVGDTATFFCRAKGTTTWKIDGTTVGFGNKEQFKAKGFSFSSVPTGNEISNLTLNFTASVEKNETEIKCLAYIHQEDVSDAAILIVMGKFMQKGCVTMLMYKVVSCVH